MNRLVRSELYKLATTPGPWVLALMIVALTAIAIAANIVGSGPTDYLGLAHARALAGAGRDAAILLAPMVGVLCITSEYRHKVLTTTLLASPRRAQVLLAKAIASVLWSLMLGILSLLFVCAMGLPWLSAKGVPLHLVTDQFGPVIPGLLGVFALLALFGLGIGTLVKNQVAGVIIIVGGTLLVEPLIVALFHQGGFDVNWFPSEASQAVAAQLNSGGLGGRFLSLLPWWKGVLALIGWSGGTAWLGYFTTFRRDVT